MAGRLVYEIAALVSETASEKIVEQLSEGEDPQSAYRGALCLALVAHESEKGTTKEELMAYLGKFYDIVHEPAPSEAPTIPAPPGPKRTASAELRLQLKLN